MEIFLGHPQLKISLKTQISIRGNRLNLLQYYDNRLFIASGANLVALSTITWSDDSLKTIQIGRNFEGLEYLTDESFPSPINQLQIFPHFLEDFALLFAVCDCGAVTRLMLRPGVSSMSEASLFQYDSVRHSAWSLAYDHGLKLLAVGSNARSVTIYNVNSQVPVYVIEAAHMNNIPSLDFHQSRFLISASIDGSFHVYDCLNGFACVQEIEIRSWLWSAVSLSVQDQLCVISTAASIYLIRNFDTILDRVAHETFRHSRYSLVLRLDDRNFVAFEQYFGTGVLLCVNKKDELNTIQTFELVDGYLYGVCVQEMRPSLFRLFLLTRGKIIVTYVDLSAETFLDFDY